jgi:hypothetical protein
MTWLMDGARKKQDDKHTGVDQTPKTHGSESDGASNKPQSNGHDSGEDAKKPPKLATKNAETGNGTGTEQADGAQKRITKSTGGATAKDAVSSATAM